MVNILIMAGGRGERFWPQSRQNHPKQLLNFAGSGSMIQETVWRVKELTVPANIYIVTNALYAGLIREQLPEIPAENIIIEPEGRNTAPCIGLAALFIEARDPEGVMVVLAADHLIKKPAEFCRILQQGVDVAAQTGGVVTLGITPDRPETGYGYIKMGAAVTAEIPVHRVERFTEKPDQRTAAAFLADGHYLWNSGIFIWQTATLRQLIATYLPQLHQGLEAIKRVRDSDNYEAVLREKYAKFEKISIDYGIMERASEVYVIPAEVGWDDVGSWLALERTIDSDRDGNVLVGEEIIALDSQDCIVTATGKRLVAAVGVRDLIYVETDDAVLLCPKSRAQDVKLILEELRRRHKEQYL
jgi:mannose-1-phosphate guanylyltransferase